jgi:hypothetical protein
VVMKTRMHEQVSNFVGEGEELCARLLFVRNRDQLRGAIDESAQLEPLAGRGTVQPAFLNFKAEMFRRNPWITHVQWSDLFPRPKGALQIPKLDLKLACCLLRVHETAVGDHEHYFSVEPFITLDMVVKR